MHTKVKLKNYLLFIAFAVVGILSFFGFPEKPRSEKVSIISTGGQWISMSNNSLPDDQYQKTKDSLNRIAQCELSKLRNSGSGLYLLYPGFIKVSDYASCDIASPGFLRSFETSYYLSLPGYRLRESNNFTIVNNRNVLIKTIWDTKLPDLRIGHDDSIEISIRYAFQTGVRGHDDMNDPPIGNLMIPVSKKMYSIFHIISWGLLIVMVLFLVYALLVIPVRILFNFSRGKAFTPFVIRGLSITGWTLLAYSLLPALLGYLFWGIFAGRIPSAFYLPFPGVLLEHNYMLLGGIAILLLGRVIASGAAAIEELEDTV